MVIAMKKKVIVEVNLGNFGSTGTIMREIAIEASNAGYKVYQAYPETNNNKNPSNNDIIICSNKCLKFSKLLALYSGYNGCFSIIETIRFINRMKKIKPDILHFHNLHNSYINFPILFSFIKKYNIRIIWTLHDCWSFTGQCAYFDLVKCQKWKNGCHNCPQIEAYPASKVDKTKTMWKIKKKYFTGVKNMTIVTPSEWLANLVKCSFLSIYPVKVINNGINLDIFKPTFSNFRSDKKIINRYIILGVAMGWEKRKGLDVFVELAKRLDDRFAIVLVGTNDEIDKILPDRIISIHRTSNQEELAEIYSSADLFVNPTREENYPTVNMESISCGTPVLTFRTGGSPEIPDERTGYVVDVDDIDEMEKQIIRICTNKVFTLENCLNRSKKFDKHLKYQEYIELYK